MKIFEHDGGTATPQAKQWLGILMLVLSLGLVVSSIVHPPDTQLDKIGLTLELPMIPLGAYITWTGYRRKRGG